MVAMNVEQFNETLRPKSHYVKGDTRPTSSPVSLMAESRTGVLVQPYLDAQIAP
jgi:hypothetical protein